MAVAVGQCNATKLLFPISHCNNVVVGTQALTLSKLMDEAVERFDPYSDFIINSGQAGMMN